MRAPQRYLLDRVEPGLFLMSYGGGGRRPRRGTGTGPLTTVVGALDTGEAFPILAAAWSHRWAGKGSPGPVPLPRRGLRSHAGAASKMIPGSLL